MTDRVMISLIKEMIEHFTHTSSTGVGRGGCGERIPDDRRVTITILATDSTCWYDFMRSIN